MPSPFDDIFGGSGPQWSREQIVSRIRSEADRQKVDPNLAVAVAMQESGLRPDNPGDNGASRGVFHLQRKAAIDAGIDPKWRDDPDVGIYGGVRYLKQKLDQSGGNVEQALSRYNRGTPDYRGIGDPDYIYHVMRHYPGGHPLGQAPADQDAYRARLNQTFGRGTAPAEPRQQPGMMARIANVFSPASAEAATATPQQPQATSSPVWDDIFGAAPAAPAASVTQPGPPTATSTPEQDAAYGASRGTQTTPPSSQAAPTPQTPPGASQGPAAIAGNLGRFLRLPAIGRLPAEEIQARAREFAALTPALQEEFLRSEEPASDLTVDIEKPSTPTPGALAGMSDAQRTAQVRQELAAWESQAGRPWREGDPRMPSEKRLGVPDEAPVTESLTAPSTMIPLLMPGAGLKLVPGALKTAAPNVYRGARAAAEGLSQTLGWGTGRTIETGQVPSPGEIGTEAALNVAAGGILEGLGATGQAILRRSQAGKAIAAADEATTAARAKWQADTQAAEQAAQSQQKELYDTAVIKAKASQREYEMAARQRQEKIAAGKQEYDEAVRAQQAEDLAKEQARQQTITQRQQEYHEAVRVQQADDLAKEQARQQTIAQRQQEYQQAITGQQQAITQARAVPGRYTPETPSWVQYEKFGDAAKDAVVDLTPAKAALAEVRASRGTLPDGSIRPFPTAVESIAANLEKATGDTSFQTIREELRRLGPLTKSQDGNVRGAAKQLYGIYADVLEASPIANDLLKNANATFRKEMAVQDIAEWLRPGHGIVRIDNQGRETINVGALMTRLEKTVADDSLFRRSFAPDELEALRKDLRQLAGTPAMPRGVPREPAPVVPGALPAPPREPAPVVPGGPPAPPREPAPVALPADVRVKQVPLPATADETLWPTLRGTPEPAPVTPRQVLGERPKILRDLTRTTMQDYLGTLFGIPGGLVLGATTLWRGGQQLRYGLARAMLNVESRPQVMETLRKVKGVVGPPLYGTMVNALSDAERKALLRDTREARERKR